MSTSPHDHKALLKRGVENPGAVLPRLRSLAASDDWKTRESAVSVLVEISRAHLEEVAGALSSWLGDPDPNVRRAAVEGARHIARRQPALLMEALELVKTDENFYVRKAVAYYLRVASEEHPSLVMAVARRWGRAADRRVSWVLREGLQKLRTRQPKEVADALGDTMEGPPQSVTFEPIGVVRNEVRDLVFNDWERVISRVEVLPQYMAALDGIDGASHLWIMFALHRSSRHGPLRVQIRDQDGQPEVGVFASRGPDRPNPIGVTAVELVESHGGVLTVRGLDAVDGSPVLDIKPYVPVLDCLPKARVSHWSQKAPDPAPAE